ncbi:MAG: hypothetical protein KGZ25_03870, partial [Planctomycetes bacterium]|nr:hypothetical protein [Planctomycetota bacterium]
PVKGWRESYSKAIENALKIGNSESLGFCVLMWMDYETMIDRIDPEEFDPEYLKAAEDAQDEMKDVRTGPFPPDVRREIYQFFIREVRRHDSDIPIYLSTESRDMWDDLRDELGQDPKAFFCGCSPVALPGGHLSLSPECPYSTYAALNSKK